MPEHPDITVSENLRLRREVIQLRERVAALEASRWWRLHPRFALERVFQRSTPTRRDQPARPSVVTTPDAGVVERFRAEVYERGDFSQDWFTLHIPEWEPVLAQLEGRAADVLELGSFEGLSACYLLWRFDDARVTCVDTFAGIPEYRAYGIEGEKLAERFDRNVALVDATRVRKLVGTTHEVLPTLLAEEARFDLLYVDASHRALDVLSDAALSWQLLRAGGIAIYDDFGDVPAGEDPLQYPAPALSAFLRVVASHAEVLADEGQLVLRKTG